MGSSIVGDRRQRGLGRGRAVALGLVLGLATAACSGDGDGGDDSGDESARAGADADVTEPEIRDELLEMMDADQAERTGEVNANNDAERTDRLREIVDEIGWPTFDQVGEDGATAAWVIAQHSDQDVELQEQVLGLMRAAVDGGQADASELAYLEDRVAVNNEQPQTYGTQVRCGPDGARPATPLVDPEGVDRLRAGVGLDPLADYLAQFEEGCAQEVPAP